MIPPELLICNLNNITGIPSGVEKGCPYITWCIVMILNSDWAIVCHLFPMRGCNLQRRRKKHMESFNTSKFRILALDNLVLVIL